MMDRARIFFPGIDPRLDHLENKKIITDRHSRIDHFAFEIDVTLFDPRRLHVRRLHRCEMKGLELIHRPAGGIAACHRLFVNSTVGILITHSFVTFKVSNV